MRRFYLTLAIIGGVVPYYFFFDFWSTQGTAINLFIQALFANSVSTAFAADLIIASIAFIVWSYQESQQRQIRYWPLFVIANLTIGLSFALPLFLWHRDKTINTAQS
ncbi:MAG: DUF2834 domain-containing protein [Pseudomonadota bacterium]